MTFNMDFTNVEASASKKPLLEKGKHLFICTKADYTANKANNGYYLDVELTHESGVAIREIFNIKNPSPKAVEIAVRQLKNLLQAMAATLNAKETEKLYQIKNADFSALLGKKTVVEIDVEEFLTKYTNDKGEQIKAKKNVRKDWSDFLPANSIIPEAAPPQLQQAPQPVPSEPVVAPTPQIAPPVTATTPSW